MAGADELSALEAAPTRQRARQSPPVLPARERAEQVRRSVNGQIVELLDGAEASPGDVYAGWTAAQDVAVCPARFLRDGETGFGFPGWSPPLAGAAVARVALAFHLRAGYDPGSGRAPLPDPVGAVKAWMTACAQGHSRTHVGDWIAEQVRARERALLAATAANAARWIGGFIRAVGWPLPEDLHLVHGDREDPSAVNWPRFHKVVNRHSKVNVAGSPDAVLGRPGPSGDHRLLVHRPTGPGDDDLTDRAAFEAVAAALSHGVVPAQVVVTAGDTGETGRVQVDDDLLGQGVELIVAVVGERVAAVRGDLDLSAQATPSSACIWCDHLDRCTPGQAWRDGPGRWSGGLPVVRP